MIRGKNSKPAGRRRNYQSANERSALDGRLPRGWANWLGFVLFGVCAIAVLAWAVVYVGRGDMSDAIVAGGVGISLAYMTFLFATTHLKT